MGRPAIAVVTTGEPQHETPVREALLATPDLPVLPRAATLPASTPTPTELTATNAALADARQRYRDADFARCLEALGRADTLETLLGAGERVLASRVQFWQIACRVGAEQQDDARREAERFAVLQLDVPADIEAVTPEVEAAIANAQRTTAQRPRVAMQIRSDAANASVSIDGRARACATPCTADVAPGDHVVRVEADGVVPQVRTIRAAPGSAPAQFSTAPASPELAAQQWTSRYATSTTRDSADSLRLLSRAISARYMTLFTATGQTNAVSLEGALVADGLVRARGVRIARGNVRDSSQGLLRELLVRGGLLVERPVYASPWFWIGITGAAALAAGITAAVLYRPNVQTILEF